MKFALFSFDPTVSEEQSGATCSSLEPDTGPLGSALEKDANRKLTERTHVLMQGRWNLSTRWHSHVLKKKGLFHLKT